MLPRNTTLDSVAASVFATEAEQYRIYLTSLDEGFLHSHQRTSKSHLGIGRRNPHVHYDVPENVRLPREVLLIEQAFQGSIHFLESVEMVLSPWCLPLFLDLIY